MLSARSLAVGHGRTALLTDVELDVAPGEIVGLVGPSGSGKTSLLRVLSGLTRPLAGEVLIDGTPPPKRPQGRVAMLFQSARRSCDPRLTLRQSIELCAPKAGVDWDALCARADLQTALLDRHPHQVSDGQLQRAAIARALAGQPGYLLCDEMTAALDPAATAAVVATVRRAAVDGAGVLFVSHDLPLVAAVADRVLDVAESSLRKAHL
ncbi:ATP-binding cassette domain-containing protein [Kribbella antibiotica]|uniref:ATP-binding cassette domain-containing protein n=1 Tax=Kribbella antibiotica TaxID=190195 RepID=A0A4R4ZWR5_9ACTN|nr:ATP-binding cassette domain-containing protein [Kribbella antibiotica]TDD62724.1 ATP-binding cassette domain-containing protein [Kribbella antibiotica]